MQRYQFTPGIGCPALCQSCQHHARAAEHVRARLASTQPTKMSRVLTHGAGSYAKLPVPSGSAPQMSLETDVITLFIGTGSAEVTAGNEPC